MARDVWKHSDTVAHTHTQECSWVVCLFGFWGDGDVVRLPTCVHPLALYGVLMAHPVVLHC